MNKDTLGGRFDDKFASYFNALDKRENSTTNAVVSGEVLSFFKEELERLAVEVEKESVDTELPRSEFYNMAVDDVVALIRAKAEEL